MPSYRPNAAIILRNSSGEILVCERSDFWGCWQFPQGGVKKGETLLDALHREVEEELGLKPKDYRILSRKGPYRYLFMNGRKKNGFDGQEQHYFLAELVNPQTVIRFEGSHEFRAARWLPPASYDLDWIGPMKREVYSSVFRDFFGIEPGICNRGNSVDLQRQSKILPRFSCSLLPPSWCCPALSLEESGGPAGTIPMPRKE